jgi:2-polyprenyl-6-hydroxyphenyl methylase/3-demethylubiquinone-9 3-methyltransferase
VQSPSVDPGEVAYYTRLAHQWWDAQGPFWPLHQLNRLRAGYLRAAICDHFGRADAADRPLTGLSVLDIGCGGGILAESMAALGASVHGVDVVERNIHVANLHAAESRLDIAYEYVSVETLCEREQRYDVVLNMEVVEHVADLSGFLSHCTQLVNDDGILFIATINRNPLSWLVAIVGAEYILRWLPIGTHRWSRFVKPRELEALLARDSMIVKDSAGVRVNPFTRQFSLTPRLSVNYMLCATRRDQ